ncbi:aminotransferase class V-fold PLP-dependent enzyme, partial [Mycobacterium tuberculosis]|nr:aminotransferase class V-fold PLP-dependent enzyme [Mycobacterium tuberculosis]
GLDGGAEQTQARVTCLATRLARRLLELPDVTVHSPSPSPCGIVSFSIGRTNPYTFVQWCEQRGISLSVTRAESTPVDMLADHPAGWIRASLH